jgi:hypothetical protein
MYSRPRRHGGEEVIVPDDPPFQKLRRVYPAGSRRDQRAPQRQVGGVANAAADTLPEDDLVAADPPPAPRPATAQRPGEHQERIERQWEHWAGYIAHAKSELISKLPLVACQAALRHKATQQAVQQALNEGWRSHCCPSIQDRSLQLSDLVQLKTEKLQFVSTECRVKVELPVWKCTKCSKSDITPNAVHIGCWPSSPKQPTMLYSLELMQSYTHAERGGLSITGGYRMLGVL